MSLRVHLSGNYDDEWLCALDARLAEGITLTSSKDAASEPVYHVLVTGRPTRAELTASASLQALIIPWAGLPVTTRDLMLEFENISIYNLHHNAAATAEMAVALMMAAAKNIVPLDRDLRNNTWTQRYEESTSPTLSGKTSLILGYGSIGKRIAVACRGLEMNVNAIRNIPGTQNDQIAQVCGPESMLDLLAQADVLFICLPLTPATEKLIGEPEISLLPRDAILVNIARGKVVDESALYRALDKGQIRAGLDVWYDYPKDEASRANTPPSQFPFAELDNVVMTPHLAGHTSDIEPRRREELAKVLNSLASGTDLPKKVDPQRGY